MKEIQCIKAEQLIVSELDEGILPADRQRLDEHLRACGACREFREEIARVMVTIKEGLSEDPGEAYWRRYDARLGALLRDRAPGPGWSWRQIAITAAVAMIFMAFGVASKTWLENVTGDGTHAAAMQDINRVFGVGSDDRLLSEPHLTNLLVGLDSPGARDESAFLSMLDPYDDEALNLDLE